MELPDLKKAAKKGFRGCIQAAAVRRDVLGRRRASESRAVGMNTRGNGPRRRSIDRVRLAARGTFSSAAL